MENKTDLKRFKRTLTFIKRVEPNCKSILDLGVRNSLSEAMGRAGLEVENTKGEDLDLSSDIISTYNSVDVVTAFEILEHLVNPFPLLQKLPSSRLIATVPLKLWFAGAYRNTRDVYDQHFHEFEDWQFDMLLNKAGWDITYREKWISPTHQLGFRPLLRYYFPRFYAVHAVRRD